MLGGGPGVSRLLDRRAQGIILQLVVVLINQLYLGYFDLRNPGVDKSCMTKYYKILPNISLIYDP